VSRGGCGHEACVKGDRHAQMAGWNGRWRRKARRSRWLLALGCRTGLLLVSLSLPVLCAVLAPFAPGRLTSCVVDEVSECSIETLKRAKKVKGLGEKVIVVQMEYSPFTLDIELPGPQGQKSFAQEAEDLGVSVIAYSPLARGLVTGRYRSRADFDQDDYRLILPRWSEENFPKNLEVVDKLKQIAQKYNATPSQVTLAWILAEHPTWIPIPGSRTIERIEENARGAELKLSAEAIKEIRELVDKAEVAGGRNPSIDWVLAGVEGNCLPLAEWKGEQST